MTLQAKIEVLRLQLTLTQNPQSIERMNNALALLEHAKVCWQNPGKQAEALWAEEEAMGVMRDLLD